MRYILLDLKKNRAIANNNYITYNTNQIRKDTLRMRNILIYL